LRQGKVDEAERSALEAVEIVGSDDVYSRATTTVALGLVRAAQGRDEEAEALLREGVDHVSERGPVWSLAATVDALARFLRAQGRDEEAAEVEGRLEPRAGVG
jgi:ATP/maltotriose-dependent transcriptional regulator MalT